MKILKLVSLKERSQKMRRTVPLILLSIVLSVSLVILPACKAEEPEVIEVIETDVCNRTSWFPVNVLVPYFRALEEESGGRLKIVEHPAGALISQKEVPEALAKGIIHLTVDFPTYSPDRWPLTGITELPLAFPDATTGSKIYWELFKKVIVDEYTEAKVRVSSPFAVGMYYPQSVSKQIRTVDDFEGLGWRTGGGKVETDLIKAYGLVPITMTSAEIYESLQRGLIEGLFISPLSADEARVCEVLKYFSFVPMYAKPCCFLWNLEFFNGLPKDLQKVIIRVSEEYSVKAGEAYDQFNTVDFPQTLWKEWGYHEPYTPTEAEMAGFRDVVQSVWEAWVTDMEAKGHPAKELLKEYNEIREKYGVKVEPWQKALEK